MRQIKHGFKDYYYLTEDGQIYNAKTLTYLTPGRSSYKLQAEDGQRRSISLSSLYALVYEKKLIQDDIERLDGEIFREIPGSEGKYLISNYGRCISYNQGSSAKLLTPICNNAGGYLRVSVKINGSFKKKLLHQLVAEAFCEKPEGASLQIHHIDFLLLETFVVYSFPQPIQGGFSPGLGAIGVFLKTLRHFPMP